MRISLAIVSSLAIPLIASGIAADSPPPADQRQTSAATQPAERQPTLDDYDALVELIATVPPWTESETVTPEEWRTLARTASALQSLDEGHMALLLVKYMKKHGENLPKHMDDPDPRTRPLLLLATMFDLDKPATSDLLELLRDRSQRGVQVCGGFNYKPLGEHGRTDLQQFALPISWKSDGPILTARRVAKSMGQRGGPPKMPYEPWAEFHHFVRFYEHRTSFPPHLTTAGPTWRELIAEREALQSASQPQVP